MENDTYHIVTAVHAADSAKTTGPFSPAFTLNCITVLAKLKTCRQHRYALCD